MPNLRDTLAADAGLAAESKEENRKSFDAGFAAGQVEINNRIDKVKQYVVSKTYPAAVSALAVKVICGEEDPAALIGAVTVLDAQAEQLKSAAAKVETDGQGETPAENPSGGLSTDGTINTEADLQAAAGRIGQGGKPITPAAPAEQGGK